MSRNKWIDDLDDLETPPEKEPRTFSLGDWVTHLTQTPYLPWIAAGVAGVLLVFGLTLFLGDDQDTSPSKSTDRTVAASPELDQMASRLERLENKVEQLTSRIESLSAGQPADGQSFQAVGTQLQNLENDFTRFKKEAQSNFRALQSKLLASSSGGGSDKESGSDSSSDSESGSTQEAGKTYTVKKGDNLYRIGLKFDVSVEQLRSWNDLSPSSEIYPGQELRIRSE
ncbi:MAG: LysM peptidoglycan-binding domain-containing protein [Desulfovermiculus sp.]